MFTRQQTRSFKSYSKLLLNAFESQDDPTQIFIFNRYKALSKHFDALLSRWCININKTDIIMTRILDVFLIDYQNEMNWTNISDFIIMTCLLKRIYIDERKFIDQIAVIYLQEYAMDWVIANGNWENFVFISPVETSFWKNVRLQSSVLFSFGAGGIMVLLIEYLFSKFKIPDF